ncbi:hypothetical protein EYC84_002165 [Monilinia fructicola]|uniref:Uncharacterized protein n=1 Tax=Monilinia fructicola TaxID=38448 RepID=A0A5M9JPT7_MONFR|nr:hypothetical protein EYC84_002165 [Monilinia fructicola]
MNTTSLILVVSLANSIELFPQIHLRDAYRIRKEIPKNKMSQPDCSGLAKQAHNGDGDVQRSILVIQEEGATNAARRRYD